MEYVDGDNAVTGSDTEVLGLHWNSNHWELVKQSGLAGNESGSQNCKLTLLKAADGGVTIPRLLYDTGLFEVGPNKDDYKEQRFWANADGTRYPDCGACWHDETRAGSFAIYAGNNHLDYGALIGFYLYHFKHPFFLG